ncbi:HET-domain-containing protein [Pseudovirgaria hyperparasitica]|uniref:HET-domain-containing protein n=1 Tax=Pseudovirgaria hyperparasitica TaxID=470096 RepID=A0A6A6W884_9PEZI|nr:HET-domain-containing protein [Pseudovirgaria hyperparasitica]KAF2758234.1 HET-domain-containing protein [Pseudovirgaria hyperparasitica]
MRLLDTNTKKLHNFIAEVPAYAILSHRWRAEEVTFQDLQRQDVSSMKGWAKLSSACEFAKSFGCDWLWMDTCCIDKTSSTELTESLNSMFRWYKKSAICIAYIDDLDIESWENNLSRASWFTRGWTLQELIAPSEVLFTTKGWDVIGSKTKLARKLAEVTGIEEVVLKTGSMDDVNVAQKLAWASNRETSRIEDGAYCLLGIFNVNMPALYGEGCNAFIRLQEEVLKKSDDRSIFAWGMLSECSPSGPLPSPSKTDITGPQFRIGLLSPSLEGFQDSSPLHNITLSYLCKRLSIPPIDGEITTTNYGTKILFPMFPIEAATDDYQHHNVYIALLSCESLDGNVIGIYLHQLSDHHFARVSSFVAPDLLSIPYSLIPTKKLIYEKWIYVTREPPAPHAVSILAMINATALLRFCAESGFIITGEGEIGELNSWGPPVLPSADTMEPWTVDAQELEPKYVLLQKQSSKLGLLLALTIEPERQGRADRNLFSVKVCVLAERGGDAPYTDEHSLEAVKNIVEFWKTTKKDDTPISSYCTVAVPDMGEMTLLMICETEPNWRNVDSYNDCRYRLVLRWNGRRLA